MAFRWRAENGPLIVVFGFSLPSSTQINKTLSLLDPLSLIRFILTLRFPDIWNIDVNGKLTKCKEIESHLSKMLFPAGVVRDTILHQKLQSDLPMIIHINKFNCCQVFNQLRTNQSALLKKFIRTLKF